MLSCSPSHAASLPKLLPSLAPRRRAPMRILGRRAIIYTQARVVHVAGAPHRTLVRREFCS